MSDVRVGLIRVEDCEFHPHNVRRDLGDLRALTASIRRYGVMQPISVERRGQMFRLRAGHRRLAASRLAGRARIPAVIHGVVLAEDEWLIHAVQENVMRRDLDLQEKVDTVRALADQGMTKDGIAEAFGVSPSTITAWEKRARGEATARNEDKALVRAANRRDRVAELTAEGRSAREIADILDVTQRTVVRARNDKQSGTSRRSQVGRPTLRDLAAALRAQAAAGAGVDDVLNALDEFVETLTVPTVQEQVEEAA